MTNFLAFGVPQGMDWIIIFVLVVLLFGAKKLPELARGLGKSLGEFKKAKEEFDTELQNSLKEAKTPATITPTPTPSALSAPHMPTAAAAPAPVVSMPPAESSKS